MAAIISLRIMDKNNQIWFSLMRRRRRRSKKIGRSRVIKGRKIWKSMMVTMKMMMIMMMMMMMIMMIMTFMIRLIKRIKMVLIKS